MSTLTTVNGAATVCRGKGDPGGPRRCDKHLKQLTAEDLLPAERDDAPPPDWAGEDPQDLYSEFPAQVANAALTAVLTALEHESSITTALLAATGDKATMAGLEFRIKSPSSLARKIATKAIGSISSPAEAAARLDDTIRYTITTHRQSDLVPSMTAAIDTLTAQGWKVHSAEHSFVAGNPYKGIHLVLVAAGGHRCEVQFHTESALATKNAGHRDYETYRNIDKSDNMRRPAFNRCVRLWDKVPTPAGLRKLTALGGVPIVVKTYRFTPTQPPTEDQK